MHSQVREISSALENGSARATAPAFPAKPIAESSETMRTETSLRVRKSDFMCVFSPLREFVSVNSILFGPLHNTACNIKQSCLILPFYRSCPANVKQENKTFFREPSRGGSRGCPARPHLPCAWRSHPARSAREPGAPTRHDHRTRRAFSDIAARGLAAYSRAGTRPPGQTHRGRPR